MNNKFVNTMEGLEGKNIKSIRSVSVNYCHTIVDAMRITCTDDTVVTIAVDPDTGEMGILDDTNSSDVTWTCSYSPRRHQLYVYDMDDNLIFALDSENLSEGLEYLTIDELRQWVSDNCSDMLSDFNLT